MSSYDVQLERVGALILFAACDDAALIRSKSSIAAPYVDFGTRAACIPVLQLHVDETRMLLACVVQDSRDRAAHRPRQAGKSGRQPDTVVRRCSLTTLNNINETLRSESWTDVPS